MTFTGLTPELLLPRSDSRNPATTCKGITKSGRPCRRAIDAKASRNNGGVLAVVSVVSHDDDDDEEVGAAAYFCWQHKDQAERLAAQTGGANGVETQLFPLQERNSIDTLVERLGVLEVEEPKPAQGVVEPRKKRRESRETRTKPERIEKSQVRPPRKIDRPPTWDRVEGPLMQVPSDILAEQRRRQRPPKPQPKRKQRSFWASLCCVQADDDYVEVVRHRRRVTERPVVTQPEPISQMQEVTPPIRVHEGHQRRSSTSVPPTATAQPSAEIPARKPLAEKPVRPINKVARRDSETTALLRYIPTTLTPRLTSDLLAELSKPISPHDDEGYIYIFWLTPESLGPAPSSTASSLLAAPARPEHSRRTSDVLRQYSVKQASHARPDIKRRGSSGANETAKAKETMLLKIGRANNVHRRMNEWTRQCGYALSLVRFYPYVPTTSTPSPSPSPHTSPAASRRPSGQNVPRRASDAVRKVPHAHRVERLIHIELGAQRVTQNCEACGKSHREWFEVEATRDGVKSVDAVVRRWVDWAERTGS